MVEHSVIAQIATLKSRSFTLAKAVESLVRQGVKVKVIQNGPGTDRPMSDGWKFYNVNQHKGYVLICDDDILYPSDFAEKMIEKVEEYDRKAVITCMGKIMKPRPIKSFYHDELVCFKTFETLTEDREVKIPGTCAMAFHSSTCPDLDHTYFQSMNSDIWMGKYCKERGIKMIVTAHAGDWLTNLMPLNPPGTFSVFDEFKNNDEVMTYVVNSFL